MTHPSEVLRIWQETDRSGNPTDREIIQTLRAVWQDAEAEIDEAQTELSHADDPFQAARWLDACIARCEAAEDRYSRAWAAFCAARRDMKMEAA